MKRVKMIVAAFLASLIFMLDPSHGYEWQKIFGGSGLEEGTSVQQTAEGGYVIAGSAYSSRVGESGGVLLIKTDADGNENWLKTLRGNGGRCVRQTADGGYIITGFGTLADDRVINGYIIVPVAIKTDANGNEVWRMLDSVAGGEGFAPVNGGYSVQPTTEGGYVIAGAAPIGLGDDVLLFNLDANGNLIWRKTFDIPSATVAYGRSVRQTKDGGFIVAGSAFNWPGMSPPYGAFVIKADVCGNEVWRKEYPPEGEPSGDVLAQAICEAADGGYVTAGIRLGVSWLFKLGEDGSEIWSKTLSGGGAFSVERTADGGYILDVAAGLLKTDEDGNELWSKSFTFSKDYLSINPGSAQETTDGGYIMVLTASTDQSQNGSPDSEVLLIYYKPDPESPSVVTGSGDGGGG